MKNFDYLDIFYVIELVVLYIVNIMLEKIIDVVVDYGVI